MIIGSTIFKMDGNPYYSPEFPRGGLAATFVIAVLDVSTTAPNVTVTIEHRNAEDTSWTTAVTLTTFTAVGQYEADGSALKELLRSKFSFDAGDAASASARFFLPAPSWRPY